MNDTSSEGVGRQRGVSVKAKSGIVKVGSETSGGNATWKEGAPLQKPSLEDIIESEVEAVCEGKGSANRSEIVVEEERDSVSVGRDIQRDDEMEIDATTVVETSLMMGKICEGDQRGDGKSTAEKALIGRKRQREDHKEHSEIVESHSESNSFAAMKLSDPIVPMDDETRERLAREMENRNLTLTESQTDNSSTPQPTRKKIKAPKLITPELRLATLRSEYDVDQPVLRASDKGRIWCLACKRHFRIDMSSIKAHLNGPRHISNREKTLAQLSETEASLVMPTISPVTDTLASGSIINNSESDGSSTAIPPPISDSQSVTTSVDLLVMPGDQLSLSMRQSGGPQGDGGYSGCSPAVAALNTALASGSVPLKPRVLLCASGSVASVKIPLLMTELSQWADVRLISTEFALHFFDHTEEHIATNIFRDRDEWASFSKLGDPILHINLRAWADVVVIAPLSANTLAKIATGLCDNLLTCVVRAWDWENKPIVLCPSMNTLMWSHPLTSEHLAKVCTFSNARKVHIVQPISKKLACGDIGTGAMEEVSVISMRTRQALGLPMQS